MPIFREKHITRQAYPSLSRFLYTNIYCVCGQTLSVTGYRIKCNVLLKIYRLSSTHSRLLSFLKEQRKTPRVTKHSQLPSALPVGPVAFQRRRVYERKTTRPPVRLLKVRFAVKLFHLTPGTLSFKSFRQLLTCRKAGSTARTRCFPRHLLCAWAACVRACVRVAGVCTIVYTRLLARTDKRLTFVRPHAI